MCSLWMETKLESLKTLFTEQGQHLIPSCSCGHPRGHPCSNFTIFVHVSKSFQNYGGAKTIIKVSFNRTRMHSIGKL